MTSPVLPNLLRGIIPPVLTPLRDPETLDGEGLERLIEHLLSGGVSGLFVLGTTGEGPCLGYSLRCQVIEQASRQAGFRVPILVGVTDCSLREMQTVARHAAHVGAHALVVAPPYYLPLTQSELITWVDALLAATSLPVFLYNMPGLTKVKFEPDTVRRLCDRPAIIGLKDSSCDMLAFHRFLEVIRERPDRSLLIGPEEMLAESVLLGGDGGVSGGANLRPELYVALYEAAARGDIPLVRQLQKQVLQLGRIYRVARGGAPIIAGLKAAVATLGLCSDVPAAPYARLSSSEKAEIERLVAETMAAPLPKRVTTPELTLSVR